MGKSLSEIYSFFKGLDDLYSEMPISDKRDIFIFIEKIIDYHNEHLSDLDKIVLRKSLNSRIKEYLKFLYNKGVISKEPESIESYYAEILTGVVRFILNINFHGWVAYLSEELDYDPYESPAEKFIRGICD